MSIKKTVFLTGLLIFNISSLWAKTDQQIREDVQNVISQRHPTETLQWWRDLGPKAPPIIIEMYESSKRIHHRMRLLGGLAAFDDPQVCEYLKKVAENPESQDVIRQSAIQSIGISAGSKEVKFLAGFLKNPDVQLRMAAAGALKKIPDSQAEEAFKSYLKEEKTPGVAEKLKGEAAKIEPLKAVAVSEDRPEFKNEGRWLGVWLTPQKKTASLKTIKAILSWKREGKSFHADLILEEKKQNKKTIRTLKLDVPEWKDQAGSAGILLEETKKHTVQIQIRKDSAEVMFIYLFVPDLSATGVFNKREESP